MNDLVVEHLHWVRTVERLRSILPLTSLAAQIAGEVNDLDAELGPELRAVLDGILATQQAVGRAVTFLDARLDAREASDG